jgi:carboxyl-terminal processing protease
MNRYNSMFEEYYFKFKKWIPIASAIMALGLTFWGGYYFGTKNVPQASLVYGIDNMESDVSGRVDFNSFWKAWNIINEKYVPTHSTTTASDQTRVYGAIAGMTASLGDPYTVFFPPVESKGFAEQISGSFEGVGMEIDIKDGILTVISPIKGSPAIKAGIKAGDKILAIDKKSTEKLSTDQAVKLIKGKKGTAVTLTILRKDRKDPFEISVVRNTIEIPTIDTEVKGDVFVLHMYNFSAISSNLFRNALRTFVESGKSKLILDLRGNPGGYLESAVDMASWFLPSGKLIVKEIAKNSKDDQEYRSRGYNIFNDNLKMAILIDGGSASASEILAGALHEQGRAILVGTRSYGKGSVQELVPITSDTSLKVTIAKWYTPDGHSISDGGLTPNVEVKFDQEKFLKGEDNQVSRAIEVLDNDDYYAKAIVGQLLATSTTAK